MNYTEYENYPRIIESVVTNGLGYYDGLAREVKGVENDLSLQIRLGRMEQAIGNNDVNADVYDLGRMSAVLSYTGAEIFLRFYGVKGVMVALRSYQRMNSDALGHRRSRLVGGFPRKIIINPDFNKKEHLKIG